MVRSFSRLLPVVGISCLVLLSISMITRIDIHSDTLFLDALMNDLFIDHGAWSAWRFSPAPSYFPDMLAYGIGTLLFDSAAWRIWFVTAVQVVAIAVLADRFVLRVRPASTTFGRGLALAATCGLVAVANHTTTMIGILFNANNIQVPTMISSLLLLILTIDGVQRRRPAITLAATLVFGALGYASSALFILSFTIPCLITLLALVVLRIDVGAPRSVLLRTAGAIVASQVLGWTLARLITWNAPLDGRLSLDAERALLAWHHFEDATANIVGLDNLWSLTLFTVCLVASLVACAAAVRLLFRRRPTLAGGDDARIVPLVVLFVLCSSITSISGAIVSGGFGDRYGYRYFMTFAAVAVLWAVAQIDRRIGTRHLSSRWAAVGVGLLSAASLGQTFTTSQRGWAEIARHGAVVRPEEGVAQCLAALVDGGIELDAGVADYWYARGVQYHLDGRHAIEPVAADLSPFFWISSLGPLERPRSYGIERYNFAIVRRELPDVMAGYDLAMMRSQMPGGYATHACDGTDADVLVYDDAALDAKVRARFDNFVFKRNGTGRLTLSGAELPSQVGTVDGDAKVVDGGPAAYLIFGPYIHLDAGRYRLELRYRASGTVATPTIGTIDVGNFNIVPPTPFAKADIPAASRAALPLDFTVPAGGAINVETRVYFNGSGRLQVDAISIVRVGD